MTPVEWLREIEECLPTSPDCETRLVLTISDVRRLKNYLRQTREAREKYAHMSEVINDETFRDSTLSDLWNAIQPPKEG